MQLSKAARWWLGAATVWVSVYPLLFMAVWLAMFFIMMGLGSSTWQPSGDMPFFIIPFFAIFPLHCITFLLQFVLMAVYLIHVIKNTQANETIRIILGIGTFMMPMIAMPVYYYLYIWLSQPPEWALAAPASPRAPASEDETSQDLELPG